ncbi:unnamed protein product [Durusdinium trenchii]|uniref:HpcH/HpaI aldolase/citrate lyase domain-containing protein n=1 Tax=Durusdinium trenchii TaxID=1381693 RepID=A0ABP0NNZ2_9DINO
MAAYYYSLAVLPMSDAVVLTYTSPVLTAVGATLLLGEVWHGLDFLGSGLCLAGVMMISKPPILLHLLGLQEESVELSPLGLLAALLAAFCATAVYLVIRILKDKDVHSLVFVNYLALAAVVTSPVLGAVLEERWDRSVIFQPALGLLFLLAALASLGETLLAVGLKLETAAKATSMNYLQVVFAFFFQGDVLHESSDEVSKIGALMISTWGVVALAKEMFAEEEKAVDMDNINCMIAGEKRFYFMHPSYKDDFEAHPNSKKNRFGWVDTDLDSSIMWVRARPCLALRAASLGKLQQLQARHFADPSQVRQNVFKEVMKTKRKQIGLWTGLRSTLVAEMLSHVSGMDWFVVDMEHSPNELNDVLLQLQASQRGSAEPVVRVPWAEPVIVKRVLDLGAQSLIFPWINSPEQAREAVEATRYPSLGGIRGVMSLARMNNYGAQNPHYYKEAAGQICNIMQIETVEALANIEAIAQVEGVDALFVGPSDLSASMGFIGQPQHPEVKAAIEDAFRRIVATGKAAGFLTANKDDAKWALKCGCSFVAVGSDMQMLTAAAKGAAAEFHDFAKSL